MLFDLQGRGRKSTIKVIYVTLAILMGGGLVFFGIGGAVSGGLLDAITENSGGVDDKAYEKRVERAEAATRARPRDPRAWSSLARAEALLAQTGDRFDRDKGTFSEDGVASLRGADRAWQRHLKLAGDKPDDNVASLMVTVYSALNKPAQVVEAQEVVTNARPSAGNYATLAQLAYGANQTRKGDLASARALDLTERDQRPALKRTLDQSKQEAQRQSASPTPTPGG